MPGVQVERPDSGSESVWKGVDSRLGSRGKAKTGGRFKGAEAGVLAFWV